MGYHNPSRMLCIINFNAQNYCSSFGLHVSTGYDESHESYSLLEDDTYCNSNVSYVWCLPRDYNREKHPFSCKYQARINWHFDDWDLVLVSWKVSNLINLWNLILACYLQVNDLGCFVLSHFHNWVFGLCLEICIEMKQNIRVVQIMYCPLKLKNWWQAQNFLII